MAFLNMLPGAIAQGLIWGLAAIGVYVSFKILDIADLSVDGTIVTGGCVCAVLIAAGVPAPLAMLAAFLAGVLAGAMTGLFHTALGVPTILAGILTQLLLYSVNLAIIGGKPAEYIPPSVYKLLLSVSNNPMAILVGGLTVAAAVILLWLFFYTEVGLTLKSTGDNPDMSRAQGVNVKRNQVLGLALSNGIVALSGALLAQYNGAINLNDGRGAIVIALAAIFIGLSVSTKIKPNLVVSLIGVAGGAIVYFIIFNVVVLLGIKTDYLKMLSSIIVLLFLAVPYLKATYFTKQKPLPLPSQTSEGGEQDA